MAVLESHCPPVNNLEHEFEVDELQTGLTIIFCEPIVQPVRILAFRHEDQGPYTSALSFLFDAAMRSV